MKNVIILGAGRTGSSILSGIISRGRYYINLEAIESREGYPGGDYENPDLIRLNEQILLDSGYGYKKAHRSKPADLDAVDALYGRIDDKSPYQTFIDLCNENAPWLWKDPRLCYTMPFWKYFLDFNNLNIIHITRDKEEIFRSYSKYKIHYTKNEVYKKYDDQDMAVRHFLKEQPAPYIQIHYPEIKQKDKIIARLNDFLEAQITPEDYDAIYNGNIRPKEGEMKFKVRYWWGISKLIFGRMIRMSGSI